MPNPKEVLEYLQSEKEKEDAEQRRGKAKFWVNNFDGGLQNKHKNYTTF